MKILALVPARGGSKRLPGKNIKMLGGMPLIGWTIRAARESGCCIDVLVSTDDPAIADVARAYGASVPWLRPAELATDTASSVDVAIHAVDAYETEKDAVDGLLLLQPTSPFRTPASIRRAAAMFSEVNARSPLVSVSPASSHPAWCFRCTSDGNNVEPFLGWSAIAQRSQDLESAWMLNGAIYLIAPERLRTDRSFVTKDVRLLTMEDPIEAFDIDTSADFALCECTLQVSRDGT